MDCFRCEVIEGELKLLEAEAAKWLTKDMLYDFPSIYIWINENMEKYALSFFKGYISGLYDGEANRAIKTEIEIEELKESVERAIMCIKARAEDLVELVKNP